MMMTLQYNERLNDLYSIGRIFDRYILLYYQVFLLWY